MPRFALAAMTILTALCLLPAELWPADSQPSRKFRRAELPKFAPSDGAGVFFDDVFTQGVSGPLPTGSAAGTAAMPPATVAAGGRPDGSPSGQRPTPAAPDSPAGSVGAGWSKLIAAGTIEDEIKAAKIRIDQAIATPTRFRSQDYKECRLQFTVLAMLFAIIEEYDAEVRWKSAGSALREAFARCAANCKTGSDQAFQEARLRQQDLQDAVGGGTVNLPAAQPRGDWQGICDRSPLMKRLEQAHQDSLQPMTADGAAFKRSASEFAHEVELVAAIGEVLQKPGMMDAEDGDYKALAEKMKQAAAQATEAVKSGNYDQARQAVGAIGQSCTACHEAYRG